MCESLVVCQVSVGGASVGVGELVRLASTCPVLREPKDGPGMLGRHRLEDFGREDSVGGGRGLDGWECNRLILPAEEPLL